MALALVVDVVSDEAFVGVDEVEEEEDEEEVLARRRPWLSV